ncbi:MAG: (d)CMP kinase [Candidatus Pelagibacter sp. TMED263]|nr:MAG: (d)CMP kinase [Candidatus Pelagibacter sp. TMED263]
MDHLKRKIYKNLIISCDGGAASGKTTGAKLIAKKYNLKFLSSGMLYRYASYLILKKKPKNKILFLKKEFKKINLNKLNKLDLNTQLISEHTSEIAKIKKIRNILKFFQISFSKKYNKCIIEGRDISTEILPFSKVKFFFVCDLNNASKRRFKDLKKKNQKVKLSEVKKSIKLRNMRDKNRKHSPLLKHRDALEIHTGKLNKKGMIDKMSKHIEKVMNI